MNGRSPGRRLTPQQTLGLVALAFLLVAPYLLPVVLDDFWVNVTAELMIWSLFAASVNLLFGYTGLLSFGQALYFGMGAYGVAFGFEYFDMSFWPAFFLGVGLGTLTAVVAGIFAVRLTWHYFAIITVVFSLIVYFMAVGTKELTGGDDGMPLSIPPVLKVGEFELSLFDQTFQYYFIMAIVALGFYLMWRVLQSPLGRAFVAVRENDMRASLIGLSPYKVRYISFVLSGFLASLAGVLFCLFARYATAQYLFWTVSGEGVVWMVVGGAGTLFGPAIGTALLIVLREELSVYWEHYLLIVGVIVILVVTFAPQGIMGLINDWVARREATRLASSKPEPAAAREEAGDD